MRTSRFIKNVMSGIALAMGMMLVFSASHAQESGPTKEQIRKFIEENKDLPDPIFLPVRMIAVIKKPNGEALFVSESGRYEFKGEIVDKWNEIELNTYEDAKYSKTHMPLEKLDLDHKALDPIIYGDGGDQRVLAFISPNGKASQAFLEEIEDLTDRFTFELVLIPNDETSRETMIALSCAADKEEALEALLNREGYLDLDIDPECNLVELQNRMIAFGLMGFQAIPTVISPSSFVSEGFRGDGWTQFLKENMK